MSHLKYFLILIISFVCNLVASIILMDLNCQCVVREKITIILMASVNALAIKKCIFHPNFFGTVVVLDYYPQQQLGQGLVNAV